MSIHALYVGHFAGNLGDSAMFAALEMSLPSDTVISCEAHMSRPWPRPATQLIDFRNKAECDEALASARAALLPGTTIVTDLHSGEWPIVPILERCRRARELDKPIHAVGVGVYPGTAWQQELIASQLVPLCETFTVRDAASRDALLAAGATEEQVTLAADLAFVLEVHPEPGSHQTLSHSTPTIAVNVVHEDWRDNDEFYRGIAAELDIFCEESRCAVRFFCNEIREEEYFDHAAAQRVAALMRTSTTIDPPAWRMPGEVIADLARCELAVSMRYHFSIFAALAHTPWIGFHRGGKMRALCDDFGLAPCGPMGVAPEGRLLEALRSTWRSRDVVRAAQSNATAALRERALRCGTVLSAALAPIHGSS